MKVGVISDIHGNSYALEKVLSHGKELKVDHWLILGDFVGYYYHADLVIKMLREISYTAIKGNHEILLEKLFREELDKKILRKKYGIGHELALDKLTPVQLNFLFNLPSQLSVSFNQYNFQLNHGSPWNQEEYIYPDAHIEILNRCDSKGHHFVLIGHSHYSFAYKTNNSLLINCGSVGQSREKGGFAFWNIINTTNGVVNFVHTKYEVANLLQELNDLDPNYKYAREILKR